MLKLYVNGQFIANASATGSLPPTPGAQAFIGRHIYGQFWNGTIANVQIYSTALTPQQIQQLYL
ncbi:LamG-like jellyroll fold domain-containing protein, partial [Thermogutta sp.]|uniref:LamG-like jellyroll fold domain-containing protein n=1 Tax=Thermogutta sp. TaxID=1962930 RepID=UPI003C7C435B